MARSPPSAGTRTRHALRLTGTLPHTERDEPMGLSFSDTFPSRFFGAGDLAQPLVVEIREVKMEQVGHGNGKPKPVLYFLNQDKALCLNTTNAATIVTLCGSEDVDEWVGQRIELFKEAVLVHGQRTPAVRVRAPHRAQAPSPAISDDEMSEAREPASSRTEKKPSWDEEADDFSEMLSGQGSPDAGEPVRPPDLKLGRMRSSDEVGE
jgi:hypothetical protein